MMNHVFRWVYVFELLLVSVSFSQKIPIQEPHLLPLPSITVGAAYFSLVPTQNFQLTDTPGGWTIQDTLRGVAISLDFELLRYRWWDHFFQESPYDGYSSLGYSILNQLNTTTLPSVYPSAFEISNTRLSGFKMNALIQELYLGHTFSYAYNHRGSLTASLATGITHLSLYKNNSGIRMLESNGLGLHLGLGWKITLLGRAGERIRLGVDLGYSLRSFDLTQQSENIKLTDGRSGPISPVQTVSFSTPELKIQLQFGEALLAASTPYRDPYRLGLAHLSIGTGLIRYQPGVTLQFDSTGTAISIPFFATVSRNIDLQIFKYNWPFHIKRQANIDVFSGMGIRFWKTLQATSLPDGWARDFRVDSTAFSGMSLAPRIFDIYLRHEILYPLGANFHGKVSVGNGFSTMTLYENGVSQRLINASSLTWQMGVGLGYTIKGDGSSKVAFGINMNYYHQAFNIDLTNSTSLPINSVEQVPISYIDLSQPVISLDIGLIFGGNANAAQKAFKAFRRKHYAEALEIQDELLKLYPNHHNKKALLVQRQMIKDSLVTRYYHDVQAIIDQGKLQNAFALLQLGEPPPGEVVSHAIEEMKINISDQALTRAAHALTQLDYEAAEEMVLLALKSDPSSLKIGKTLLARSYIIRATILYRSGVFGRSLFWLKQADGLTDRYQMVTTDLRQKIGDGRLDDANEGILKEDRQMVYTSMEDAKNLNPVLTDIVNEYLQDLEAAISHVEEQELGSLKRMALDNLLEDVQGLDPKNFSPRIGMKASLIANYVGSPARKFQEGSYELWVYQKPENIELWLYLKDGLVEKIDYREK